MLLKAGAHLNIVDEDEYHRLHIIICRRTKRIPALDEVMDEVTMLLFAAGETTEGMKDMFFGMQQGYRCWVFVPDFILQLLQKPVSLKSLKEICRDILRKNLIEINQPKNLFCIVPLLGLPSLLKSYLLYDMSLE